MKKEKEARTEEVIGNQEGRLIHNGVWNHFVPAHQNQFLKVHLELLYDPAIPLLDVYPKEC
jgi:hypothetical protein